jgi:hypothetical protein
MWFLPFERLPAFILGPIFCASNAWFFFSGELKPTWDWLWEFAGFALGVWLIWYRATHEKEPFQEDEASTY